MGTSRRAVRVFKVQDGEPMRSSLSLRLQDAIVGLAFAMASVGCATVEQPKAERYVAPPLEEHTGHLGKVSFANSCDAKVQMELQRAFAMLHSFWFSAG